MKKGINIEKLENLPKRLGLIKNIKVEGIYYKYLGTTDEHSVNGAYPWTIAKRVLNKFYKKNVDEAFSYYCTLVPKYQQHVFWQNFEFRRYRWRPWYLDENKNIQNEQFETKKDKTVHIKSFDYEVKYVLTDYYRQHYQIWNRKKILEYSNWYDIPRGDSHQFEQICVRGQILSFSSKNDPGYQRIYQERQQALKKQKKAEKLAKKEKEYSLLSKAEVEAKKQKENEKVFNSVLDRAE